MPVNNDNTSNTYPDPDGGGGNPPPSTGVALGPLFEARELRIQIKTNAALVQYMVRDNPELQSWHYAEEVYLGPGAYCVGNVLGFQAKDAVSGSHAAVSAEILGPRDPYYISASPV